LSIFATALWELWRRHTFSVSEQAILSGLFAAYFFQNLFFFDSTTSYILFGIVLAYIVSRSYRDKQEHAIAKIAVRGRLLSPFVITVPTTDTTEMMKKFDGPPKNWLCLQFPGHCK